MGDEVVCLSGAVFRVRVGEVVCAADEPNVVGPVILLCEIGAGVAGAFCCLRVG